MAHVVVGLFKDSDSAGKAVAALKEKDYTKDISVIAKDPLKTDGSVESHSVKEDGNEGAATGASVGAVMAGGGTLLAGITAATIPGVGLVAGAIATALAAATAGATAGGLIGWLVDKGIPDNTAQEYQASVERGDVLVAVEVEHEQEAEVQGILNMYAVHSGTVEHNE